MPLYDRPYMTFCWFATVIVALSGTIFELLTLCDIMTLKSGFVVTQDHSNWYHSKALVQFLFVFHSNYGSILHHLPDKAIYRSKIVIFS